MLVLFTAESGHMSLSHAPIHTVQKPLMPCHDDVTTQHNKLCVLSIAMS